MTMLRTLTYIPEDYEFKKNNKDFLSSFNPKGNANKSGAKEEY
jgi:hypothetical protein